MDQNSKRIFDRHSDRILGEASRLFETTVDSLKKLGSFESFVYEYTVDGQGRILKLTHSLHRTRNQIQGELEWVDFLARGGVSVSPVIPSVNGKLVETVEVEDSYFLVYAFEKAEGSLAGSDTWNECLYETWGRTVGRMHALTKSFRPSNPDYKRFEWWQDPSLRIERHVPKSQPLVIERGNQLKTKLRALSTDPDSYGLVHSDMHHGNFFVSNGSITAFDFDDCHYNWFAFDISIPLFYVLRDHRIDPEDSGFAGNFMSAFMAGYTRENRIEPHWMARIPDFLKLRELDLYTILYAEAGAELNDWCRRFLDGRRERIEQKVPIIEMDFERFG